MNGTITSHLSLHTQIRRHTHTYFGLGGDISQASFEKVLQGKI